MDDSGRRAKRMKPIVKARQVEVDQESVELAQIRNQKTELVKRLRQRQDQYEKGVERLNQCRAERDTRLMETLERGVDLIKQQWFEALRELRSIEESERQKFDSLVLARQKLKAVETLENRYQNESDMRTRKREQNQIDEFASKRHFEGN